MANLDPNRPSVQWKIVQLILQRLREHKWPVVDGDGLVPINPESIVFKKNQKGSTNEEEGMRLESLPGMILTPAGTVQSPPDSGTNECDDIFYPFMLQIVDEDGGDTESNYPTYSRWAQDVRRLINNKGFPDDEFDGDAFVKIGYVIQVDNVDESKWTRHELFQSGVEMQFRSRETREV